jgi:hypothetical protein
LEGFLMSDSYYSMYGDPRQDEGVLSDMIPYVAKPAPSPSSAVIPRMALGQNPPVSSQIQMAPPAAPAPQQQQSSGDTGGLSSLLGSLGGMGGMGGGGMGGDVKGFGSAPISNQDSDDVFDSMGNIADGGGDTSDWADVAYTAAKIYAGFAAV